MSDVAGSPPVGSPEALATWRRQLKPWLAALRDAHVRADLPPLATVSDMETLWLAVLAPTERRNNPSVWTLMIEALELLELLARVDHATAWRLLFEAADSAHLLELYGEQLLPAGSEHVLPRFLVHLASDELLEETEITIQSCIRFIIVNEQTSSPKFGRIREALMAQWKERHDGREFDRETEGRVQISLNFRASMDFEDEAETAFVFTQIQNVAFAHADLSLLERADRNANGGEAGDEGDDSDDEDGEEDDGEEEQAGEDQGEAEDQDAGEEGNEEEAGTGRPSEPRVNGEAASENEVTSGEADAADVQYRNPNPPPRGPFVIESFRFELLDHPISNILLYMLNEAGKSGMCMSHVQLSTVWHERLHHSVIGGFLLNQLVPWRGRRDTLGISNLSIDLGSFDAAGVRAFCTAIAHSRSLREFRFDMDEDLDGNPLRVGGEVWWPWLAYALFSGDADHQIHTVVLNVDSLETGHVDIVRQVLTHSDPLAFLYERVLGQASTASTEVTQAMAASLNPGAYFRLGHHRVAIEGDEAPGLRVREPGVTYQVIRNRASEDYIEFLLPGTGVCWTERNEVLDLHPLARRDQHPVRKLVVDGITDETAPGFIGLLSLVGEPLEELTITSMHGTMTTAVFQGIHASCKNLKRLNLTFCILESLSWLCEPDWALESLSLTGTLLDDDAEWSRLLAHLSDPTTALSKALSNLHVGLHISSHPSCASQDRFLTMLGDMLDKNHRLVRCEVSRCVENELAKHETRIKAHHGEPVCVEKAPISRKAKLAFLSVTTPPAPKLADPHERKRSKVVADDTVHHAPARTKLDPPVLRTILTMAAECERRVCGISSSGADSEEIEGE